MSPDPAPPAPFPFIVGCPRSGTTLLRGMLDSHPEIAVPGESHFIVRLLDRRDEFEGEEGLDAAAFLEFLAASPRLAMWQLPADRLRETLARNPPAGLAGAIRRLYALYAELRGKRRYGDKTPRYVTHVARLAAFLPEARFVHLVRDGRDVALSLLDVEWGPGDIAEAARYWRDRVAAARRDAARLGPERVLEIRYEELVADPAATLARVCGFLDLEYRSQMLEYHRHADQLRASFRYPERHARLSLPPTVGIRDWRSALPAAAVAAFEKEAGALLAELGYETRHRW